MEYPLPLEWLDSELRCLNGDDEPILSVIDKVILFAYHFVSLSYVIVTVISNASFCLLMEPHMIGFIGGNKLFG